MTRFGLKKVIREKEEIIQRMEDKLMNAKQAAAAAAKEIERLEAMIRKYTADVRGYNKCITGMINGESPCGWCEDREECQLSDKDGKGCENWWLAFDHPDVTTEPEEGDADDSKGIFSESIKG